MSSRTRQVIVIVEGREYVVEVGDLDARPIQARVNQRNYEVQVKDQEGGAPKANGATKAITPAPVASRPIPAPPAPTPAPAAGGAGQIVAPMPGDIVEIMVQPGDQVSPDQVICVLEAMKMKNMIRSPQAGQVAAVHVRPGEAVAYGAVLVTFE